jgi:surface antigen
LRKNKRVWAYYFAQLLAISRDALLSLQWRLLSLIQKCKASSFVTSFVIGLSIIALLGGVYIASTQSSVIVVEKSQVLSQSICSSCTSSTVSTNSSDGSRESLIVRYKQALTKQVHITSTPTATTIVSNTPSQSTPSSTQGSVNVFPYGSCTWWANQRYYQLHRIFVPWRTQSNAWQWTARAYQFGWHVSNSPVVGAIINLQPGVEGASWAGHVAVVERILSNGHVITSNMNWGAYPWQVTYVEFAPGPGVTFIYL